MGKTKKKNLYTITSKNVKIRMEAPNRDIAFAKFFKDVADGKVPLSDVGNIVMLKDGKNEYPFRTVPLLWQMKVIDLETAVANIVDCVGGDEREAKEMLFELGYKDSRLIPIIERLRREELR